MATLCTNDAPTVKEHVTVVSQSPMPVAALAQAAGLTLVLEGVIGREHYQSVTGSLEALERFAQLYHCAHALDSREALDAE